jgi:hypothetical protein
MHLVENLLTRPPVARAAAGFITIHATHKPSLKKHRDPRPVNIALITLPEPILFLSHWRVAGHNLFNIDAAGGMPRRPGPAGRGAARAQSRPKTSGLSWINNPFIFCLQHMG